MGECFYKPPIMVDYRKCFSVVNHVFIERLNPPKKGTQTHEIMDRR